MKFVLLIYLKLLKIANSFLLNTAEHEISLLINMKFSYLLAEKISCSAELSMKKNFITLLNPSPAEPRYTLSLQIV